MKTPFLQAFYGFFFALRAPVRLLLFSGIISYGLTMGQAYQKAVINTGAGSSNPFGLLQYGSSLVFNAMDTLNGYELWEYSSQGTANLLADIRTGSKESFPHDLIEYNGAVYFSASDGIHGHELWKYDGTSASLVADIYPDSLSSWPDDFVVFKGDLYFSARDSAHGIELWKYNGSSVSLVADLYPDTTGSAPGNLTLFAGKLYFSATDSAHGRELWSFDSTSAALVQDIRAGIEGSFPIGFYEHAGVLYFQADDSVAGAEIWQYNGIQATLVADIHSGTGNAFPYYFTSYNGLLYFSATNGTTGQEIYQYDGTSVTLAADLNAGPDPSYPANFTAYADELYFTAQDGVYGFELWKMDTALAVNLAADINPNAASSCPINLTVFNGELYFRATDGAAGAELWSYRVCDPPDTPSLNTTDSLVCKGNSVTITVSTGDSLYDSPFWVLHADSVNGPSLDSSATGLFSIQPDTTRAYFVRGEGCEFPGEADSIRISVFAGYVDSIQVAICAGTTYPFGNQLLDSAGMYTELFTSSDQCDSTVVLDLTVSPTFHDTIQQSICDGDTFSFDTLSLTTAGTYSITYASGFGCDSVEVLQLTVNPSFQTTDSITICQGETVQHGSQFITTSGSYLEIYTSSQGCDSTATLVVNVLPTISQQIIRHSICTGDTFQFGNRSLITSGTYSQTFQSTNQCDSVVTLFLTVHPEYRDTTYANICAGDTFQFDNQTLTSSGTYTNSYFSSQLCDSLVTVVLSVSPTFSTTDVQAICAGSSYTFGTQLLTAAGNYTELFTSSNGCDSLVQLTLSILPSYRDTLVASICDGDTLVLGSQQLTQSGTYSETFTTVPGCDSIVTVHLNVLTTYTHTMRVSLCAGETYSFGSRSLDSSGVYFETYTAQSGCDSTVRLTLTINDTYHVKDTARICSGQSYFFAGQFLNLEGTYRDTLITASGCDSIVDLMLFVSPTYAVNTTMDLCEGDSIQFGSQLINSAGNYTETFVSGAGCDSLVNLTVNELAILRDTLHASICAGSTYLFNGQVLSNGGVYTAHFQRSNSCDSVVTLYLTVYPSYGQQIQYQSICDGDTFYFGNRALTIAGTYSTMYQTARGCDSLVSIYLSVNPAYQLNQSAVICSGDTFTWGRQQFTTSGTYMDSLSTADGCDSIMTLSLTVLSPMFSNSSLVLCEGDTFNFGTQQVHSAGNYTETFSSQLGCDSIVQLTVQIIPAARDTVVAAICSGSTYAFNGQSLSVSGTYSAHYQLNNGCDSVVTLFLTVNPSYPQQIQHHSICDGDTFLFGTRILTTAGTYSTLYQTAQGCDSLVSVYLSVLPSYQQAISHQICNGDTFSFGNHRLSSNGTYRHTFHTADGCDSTVTLTLTVLPAINTSASRLLCVGDSILFGSQIISATGNYTSIFTSKDGCDSTVNLSVQVLPVLRDTIRASICSGASYAYNNTSYSSPGFYNTQYTSLSGCDSIVTLALSVLPSYSQQIVYDSICSGDTVYFGNHVITSTGVYSFTFQTSYGCDSVVSLFLTVHPTYSHTLRAEICTGQTYQLGSQTLAASGVYFETFNTQHGCDSTIRLTLTVKPVYITQDTAAICDGQNYPFGGASLSLAGDYTHTFLSSQSCDSTVQLHLEVNPLFQTTDTVSICDGELYQFGHQSLTNPGDYVETFYSQHGCDSTVQLHFIVNPTYNVTRNVAICEGEVYQFGHNMLTIAGTYLHTFQSQDGCDSLVTLVLRVNPNYIDTTAAVICVGEKYPFGTQVYSQAGTYLQSFPTSQGCDSVKVLFLQTLPSYDTAVSIAICHGSNYTLGTQTIDETGTYNELFQSKQGCDSSVTLHLDILKADASATQEGNLLTANAEGKSYQWYFHEAGRVPIANATDRSLLAGKNGYYSVKVTDGFCSSFSDSLLVATVGISLKTPDQFTCYPNPAHDRFYLEWTGPQEGITVELVNGTGQAVWSGIVQQNRRMEVPVETLADGIYVLKIQVGSQHYFEKIILH